jgi:hypothetical protein
MTTKGEVTSREHLLSLATGYLDALVDHDLSGLPLAPDVKLTEDSQRLAPGTGLVGTITNASPDGRRFADPSRGEVGLWTQITELAGPAMLAIRLKAERNMISEIETLVIRGGGALFAPEKLILPEPAYSEVLDPSDRPSSEELIRAANHYFDGIEQNNGDLIPVAPDCVRVENGIQTTLNRPDPERDEQMPGRTMGVADQISAGYFTYIEAITDRRVSVVDEERGLVLCHIRFDHPGNITTAAGRIPLGYPCSLLAHEVFKVSGGLIRRVEAVGHMFPYRMASGW